MMKRIAVLQLVAAAALAAPAAAQDAGRWDRISGTWSAIERPREVIVQDEDSWRRLWAEHANGSGKESQPPAFRPSEETIVAVFLGHRPKGQPLEIVVEKGASPEQLVIKYAAKPDAKGFGIEAWNRPFAIQKIPKARYVRFESGDKTAAPSAELATMPETGVRDSVAQVSGRLRDVFGKRTDTLNLNFDSTSGQGAFVKTQAPPPPPGGQQEKPLPGQGKPLPGQQNPQQGKPLPGQQPPQQGGKPLPGQGNQGGSPNEGMPLPPPPKYKPRPSNPGNGRIPMPPGDVEYDTGGVTTTGHWHMYFDRWGRGVEDYGSWKNAVDAAAIKRGGSETNLGQQTRYTANLESESYRNRYLLYWRYVGRNCDPQAPENCEDWYVQYRWFYEGREKGRTSFMTVEVEFERDQQLLPWESESFRVTYDGATVDVEQTDPSFRYAERGPIIDVQNKTARITLTPGARILRAPEAAKVTAQLVNEGGRLKVHVDDQRARYYAGEPLEVVLTVYKVEKMSWRNPLGRDTKVFERSANGPERFTVDPANPRRTIDLGITGSGDYYIDSWSFRRPAKKISGDQWVGRGKGNAVKL